MFTNITVNYLGKSRKRKNTFLIRNPEAVVFSWGYDLSAGFLKELCWFFVSQLCVFLSDFYWTCLFVCLHWGRPQGKEVKKRLCSTSITIIHIYSILISILRFMWILTFIKFHCFISISSDQFPFWKILIYLLQGQSKKNHSIQ